MLVSCIIPTRNRPEYLQEAAASVLWQSHSSLELIIINDGITPVDAIDDPRVRILNSAQSGAVPARNLGVATATGDAIAWLDDDDQWTDQLFLADCVAMMARGASFIFGDGTLAYPDGKRKAFALDADATSLETDNNILISSVCYRRDLHLALGMFDDTLPYYWDWDWYLRVARAGHRLNRIQRSVVDIRIHAQNMSGQSNAVARADNLAALARKHQLHSLTLKSHADLV